MGGTQHDVEMLFLCLPHLAGSKSRHADLGFARAAVANNNGRAALVNLTAGRFSCSQLRVI